MTSRPYVTGTDPEVTGSGLTLLFGSEHGDLGVIGAVHFNPHTDHMCYVFTLAEPSSEAFYCCGRIICY